ncbi:hypothetical protein EV2_037313 [Malus domestica]|uniref:Uncharacterized protein n=1 Tax=Malus domestica TaxID=3750 RepID=A0A498K0A5_MALDO|nr:hypothetical protein DVH24_011116 [Malus domestica]
MKVLAAAAPLPQRSFFTHRIVDPIPAPIRQTGIKDVGNFKAKSGSWKLISYDFGAEDPPRHVGNEGGFRVFGERGYLTPTII